MLIPVNSSAWNQTQALNDYLTSSSSDTSRARRAPTDAAMTLSTASSSEKRSKKRKPASSSRRRTLPFSEEANSPALAWKMCQTEPGLRLSHLSWIHLWAVTSQYSASLPLSTSTVKLLNCVEVILPLFYPPFILQRHAATVPQCKKPLLLKSEPIFWVHPVLPHHPSQNHHVSSSLLPVPLGGMLALPPKVRWKCRNVRHRSIHFAFCSWHIALWVGLVLSHLLQKMHIMKLAQTTGVKGSMPRIGLSEK